MKLSWAKSSLKRVTLGFSNEVRGRLRKFILYIIKFPDRMQREKLARMYGVKNKTMSLDAYIGLGDIGNKFAPAIHSEYIALKNGSEMKNISNHGSAYVGIFDGESISAESAMFTLALNKGVLELISGYMGSVPILHGIRLLESRPLGREGKEEEAWNRDQLWHRDKYDKYSIRLFVYLTEVDEDSGPFEYFKKSVSDTLVSSYYRRSTDTELVKKGVLPLKETVTGGAGSSFLVDVRNCVHCGSKCRTKDRVAFTAIYTSSTPWIPDQELSKEKRVKLGSVYKHPLQQAALKMSSY
jgi:hypothetical protein